MCQSVLNVRDIALGRVTYHLLPVCGHDTAAPAAVDTIRSKSYGATAAMTPRTARELSGIRFGKLYMKLTIILPIQLQQNRSMG